MNDQNNSGTPPPLPSLGRTSRSRGVPDLDLSLHTCHVCGYEIPLGAWFALDAYNVPTCVACWDNFRRGKARRLLWAWGLALAFVIGAVVVWAVTR